MRRGRLRWYGRVERKGDASCVKACARFVVEGAAAVGRPKTRPVCLPADMYLLKMTLRTCTSN